MTEKLPRSDVRAAKISGARTICEVHREIYDILYDNFKDTSQFEELTNKLQEAYTMAKKMNAKLKQYKHDYDKDWWEKESRKLTKEKLTNRAKRNASIKHE